MAPRRRRAPTARSASPRGTPTAIASTASHSAGSGSRSTLRRPPVCYLKPFIRLQTHKIKSTYVRVCACSRPLITHQHTLFSTAIASTASDLAGSDSRSTLTNRYAFLKPLIQTNTRSYFSICISFYSYLSFQWWFTTMRWRRGRRASTQAQSRRRLCIRPAAPCWCCSAPRRRPPTPCSPASLPPGKDVRAMCSPNLRAMCASNLRVRRCCFARGKKKLLQTECDPRS